MFSIGFLTADILILLILLAFVFFISAGSGKKHIFRFILLSYPAILIFMFFPFYTPSGASMRLALFFALLFVFIITLGKSIQIERSYNKGKFLDGILLAFSSLILILTLHRHILDIGSLYEPTFPIIDVYFEKIPFGLALLLPILILIIVKKRGD